MIIEKIKNIVEDVSNLRVKYFTSPKGELPIVIQGIQRSGTNYLNELLKQYNYKVLNYYDPQRNDPKHKHFRWQHEKDSIRMDKRYNNNLIANSIEEINAHSGYKVDTKHLVIFRAPEKWLGSIYRWGLANRWFSDEVDFFSNKLELYINEWDSYYHFWQKINEKHPSSVFIINYDNLRQNTIENLNIINKNLNISHCLNNIQVREIKKVRHSQEISKLRDNIDFHHCRELESFKFTFNYKKYM